MRILPLAGLILIAVTAAACGPDPGAPRLPTQPDPVTTQPPSQPPPAPPPAAPTGARRIELTSVVSDQLRNGPLNADCPAQLNIPIPCRHFAVEVPADGLLRVEVDWIPQPGAEAVSLVVGGVKQTPELFENKKVVTQRVLAGATYGITVAYLASHFEYIVGGPALIGEFTLKATFEK